MWYCLRRERFPAGITKELLEEVPSASSLTLRISTGGRHMRCQACNLTWWKWQQRRFWPILLITTIAPEHLIVICCSCQEQDTAIQSGIDPVYPSGKYSFLVTLHLGSRKAEAISGPCLNCQEGNREHHFLKNFWGIWWLLHCAPKPQSKEAVPWVTQSTCLWPRHYPTCSG